MIHLKDNSKIFLLILVFCLQGLLQASDNFEFVFPAHSIGSLSFDVDLCQLDGTGDSTTVEIIYSVFLKKDNSNHSAEDDTTTLSIDLSLYDKSNQLIHNLEESKTVLLYDSLNQNIYTTYMDIKKFNLIADTLLLDLHIKESQKNTKGQVSQLFKVRRFKNEFSISDFYFASHVQRAHGSSVFEKSGALLIPNPSRLFFVSGDAPKIFVYYEINNLTFDKNKPGYYETHSVVEDLAGNQVYSDPKKQIKITSENISRIKVIPIAEFASGVYHLTIEVVDVASGLRKEVSAYFKVNKGNTEATNILPMSEAEAKKYFDQIKYIATDQEKDIYNKLDARGKQEFLFHFWKSRDPDPDTAENEFMIEHFRRLDLAERKFKGGSASDMGRVYIMYGPPADTERQNTMMIGAQVIETWVYVLDGRTDFVFVDRDGDGKYTLIHSTHRDEYSNPDWREQITTRGN
jgi:GWxTD domain-containing protein